MGRSRDGIEGGRLFSRRALLQGVGAGALALALGARPGTGFAAAPAAGLAPKLVIDLPSEPPTLDPALTYDNDGWSIVHSIYDSLVQYDPQGELEPLLAESYKLVDPRTYEFKLRAGIRFHNGEPFDAQSVVFTVAHILDKQTASQVADTFRVIEAVQPMDALTVRFHLSQPAPWLLSQAAPYLAMLPPKYAADPKNDFARHPVGTGPYRFRGWQSGQQITLAVNPDYFAASPKGRPTAQQVVYRTVPDPTTRVADLLAGTAGLIRDVPLDQVGPVRNSGAQVIVQPISGSAWVRIATDVAPFADVRVRQALNYAVDVETIVQALLGGNGQRLANFFPPSGLGYAKSLAPYPYDPEQAKALLAAAGVAKGQAVALDYSTSERADIVDAVANYLSDVGLKVSAQPRDKALLNQTWKDPKAAPLRFSTWRPLFDPYSLLGLVVSNNGFLSRYDNPKAQPLIEAGAVETDPAKRAQIYQNLGRILHDEPAAIYLYGLTALYGSDGKVPWTPRPDDYIIATVRG